MQNGKMRSLKLRCYVARLNDLNGYLASFLLETFSDRFNVTELYEIILNSMSNSCSKKSYSKVFYCESISFQKGY